ncbi:hypothetical protein QVD17_18213 [Tagetes erecta]|uniref:Uncharacterized protein n=1 Tax=Tagetes erecta TaxID=13708 RepID=A0AAD8KH61_TARER|nr:hypothetical protein QVD17_18213 [Tagetes erecta]
MIQVWPCDKPNYYHRLCTCSIVYYLLKQAFKSVIILSNLYREYLLKFTLLLESSSQCSVLTFKNDFSTSSGRYDYRLSVLTEALSYHVSCFCDEGVTGRLTSPIYSFFRK